MTSEGVYWTSAHEDSGSRQNGWELLRERLRNVMKPEGARLFVFDTCRQFIRTVPVLPRDEIDMDDVGHETRIDMDDVDGAGEDHVGEPGTHPGDERQAGSAAVLSVAFPAEQRA